MCMVDDEQDSATCYDQQGTSAPGEVAAEIIGGLPSEVEGEIQKLTGICPKCLLFWIAVIAVILGIWYYRK